MAHFGINRAGGLAMNDRMITTSMSAQTAAALLKKGWSIGRIARTIHAEPQFVEGIQRRAHVLTVKDIELLAERSGQTVNRMVLNSLLPVRAEMRPLFDSIRDVLEASEGPVLGARRRNPRK